MFCAIRMKIVTLLTALATAAALAQDPAKPDEKPTSAKPAEAPSATKPELKPSSPDTVPKPPVSTLKPTPDLPELPSPGDDPDLGKGQPGGKLKPVPGRIENPLETGKLKIIPGSTADRPKTRTTLKPPTTASDLDLRIRFRKAQSRAASEPAIQALWEESRVAVTDFDKREALKSYYQLLFKRMLSLDKGIAPLVEDRKRYSLRRLDQTRIEPTDPLEDGYQRFRRDY
jgi:hypothetical protein